MTRDRRRSRCRPLCLLFAALVLHSACPPWAPAHGAPAIAGEVRAPLAEARELIKEGEYDRAIEILKAAVVESRGSVDEQREAYLLLIKTYVILGNSLRLRPQGREASNLNYEAAKELIAECLGIRALRHTRPEPAVEYPPEMIGFFAEARGRMFGSIRIVGLDPADAVVLLDGDTLRATTPGGALGDVNVAAGSHSVTIRSEGFKSVEDDVAIPPGAILERSYRLDRKRSRLWYATVAAGAATVVAGIVILAQGSSGGSSATQAALPGPPPPPAD